MLYDDLSKDLNTLDNHDMYLGVFDKPGIPFHPTNPSPIDWIFCKGGYTWQASKMRWCQSPGDWANRLIAGIRDLGCISVCLTHVDIRRYSSIQLFCNPLAFMVHL